MSNYQRYDPRRHADGYFPLSAPNNWTGRMDEQWRIEGWNDGDQGGCVSVFGSTNSLAEALERAERFIQEGDADGDKYDHVDIVHIRYRVCAFSEVLSLDEARQML